jgi:WhiB family redox-sensing transcriptional regulator
MSTSESVAATQPGWRSLSACRGEDPELFFPVSPFGPGLAQLAMAQAICAACCVRAECLRFALQTGQEYGVWGGLSEQERSAMLRTRPVLTRRPVATPA